MNTNKKYTGSPTAPLDSTLKGKIQGKSDSEGVYLVNEPHELGQMLLLNNIEKLWRVQLYH